LDRRLFLLEHEIDGLLKRKINYTVKEGESGRFLDYTGLLNEKENQIIELEKKIQNLEERLRRAGKRENELEDEIVRLKSAVKSVNNPNITRADIEKILIGAQEYSVLDDKFTKLRTQLSTFAGLITSQFSTLRGQGIRFEYESNLFELLKGQNL
jgi:DNA repair exonuclease SbcCD ATPase subunit